MVLTNTPTGRVKLALESAGSTDNYYRRACAILSGQPDPMAAYLGDDDDSAGS